MSDPIIETIGDGGDILAEPVGRIPVVLNAACGFEGRGKIPMVEGRLRGDPGIEQFVDELIVVVESGVG